ncbi:serine hydrolase domain-containing protein [Thalassoglobus sp.]|uniref:serine hydrolase domain-containing protein n=1 Tax=Thalassoglobus sp. TaxID=2795869 RepID=UPI003AA96902
MLRLFFVSSLCCLLISATGAAEEKILERVSPSAVGMDEARLERIDRVVADGLRRENMPGCVVLVGHKGKVVFEKAYGFRQLKPQRVPMTLDTVFDLASLTKPVSTATSIMMLIEQGKIDVNAPASKYLPEFTSHGKDQITIKQLLTHQGGLIPDNSIKDYQDGRKVAFQKIHDLSLRAAPGEKFMYTDVGFIVLGEIIERLSGQTQDEFTRKNIFGPLGMMETGYTPAEPLKERSAVTQERNETWMQGEVHDPRAYAMDGIAGHAGLFSTAQDLARYAQMVLNGGTLAGTRILKAETVKEMTQPIEVSSGIRSLGWDKQTGYSSNKGDLLSDQAIGHGGFTGTALWIDPGQDLFVIFLSNRVHPDGNGSVNSLAGRIATIAAAAID